MCIRDSPDPDPTPDRFLYLLLLGVMVTQVLHTLTLTLTRARSLAFTLTPHHRRQQRQTVPRCPGAQQPHPAQLPLPTGPPTEPISQPTAQENNTPRTQGTAPAAAQAPESPAMP
eukprot:TRINITY_DN2562_c0_g1_i11.p1 TRINITY_DN2562_c0_g1~~TRINITY_DN2562_c0_g1_i11.p1  ORF type:complete len:115 (-),score=20.27 TRINITY_DN2562_c0_g1_i11:287-631(-)